MRFSRSLPAAFAAVLLAAAAVHGPILRAAPSGEENPTPPVLKTSVGSSPSPLVSPGEGVLHLSIGIPTGYHLFGGAQLKASLEEAGGLAASPPRYPKGTVEEGQEVLRGNVVVDIPVRVAGGLAAKVSGNILLDWQGCQDFGAKVCFLPTRTSVPFTVKVAAAAAEAAPPKPETPPAADLAPPSEAPAPEAVEPAEPPQPAPPPAPPKDEGLQAKFAEAARANVPLALAMAFLFGLLSSLTPCVYPVIPITVAYIGSRSEGKGKLHGFRLSLAFVLGLALVYATVGALSARAGAAFGSLTQTPWVGLPMAALFFALALSMFNLFELKTPAFLSNRIEKTKQSAKGGGFLGAALVGALSGLVASPCIGPLILAILVVVAATGSPALGFLYLFVYALGLGVLFVVIGTFSGALASLPKSGGWMDAVRIFFGALILLGAFYFAGLYLPRDTFWLAAGLGLGFVGGFLLFGASRHFFAPLARAAGLLLAAAALAAVVPLLPPDLSRQEVPRGDTLWRSDADAGLAEAKVQKKPVLLDFRADWCVACLELERNTWPDPGVESLLATTIPVRMDMTRKTDANDALQRRFGVLGLPTVILVAPSGAELGRFTGYKNAEAFTEWFRSVGPESGGRREGAPGVHGGGS